MNLKRQFFFTQASSKRSLLLYQRLIRDENLSEVSVSSFFRADNYIVARDILVNKYSTVQRPIYLAKLRAAFFKESPHFPDE